MSAAPKGTNVQFRREWNKEEYAEKAKKKDEDEKERMKDNEERLKQGARPAVHAHIHTR
jgi:U4/U6.U5 tri-snRNP component SNU23